MLNTSFYNHGYYYISPGGNVNPWLAGLLGAKDWGGCRASPPLLTPAMPQLP